MGLAIKIKLSPLWKYMAYDKLENSWTTYEILMESQTSVWIQWKLYSGNQNITLYDLGMLVGMYVSTYAHGYPQFATPVHILFISTVMPL